MDILKPVFVIIHSPTWFIEMFRVAHLLQKSAEYEPLIFWAVRHHRIEYEISTCMKAGLKCLDLGGNLIRSDRADETNVIPFQETFTITKQSSRKQLTILPQWILTPALRMTHIFKSLARRVLIPLRQTAIYRTLDQVTTFRNRKDFLLALIERYQPTALILAGDNVGYDTSVFIKAAHEKRRPVLIVPSTMSNGLEEAEVYYHAPDFWMNHGINSLAGKLYPRWVWQHRGRRILRMQGPRVLAMEWLGLAPPLPWVFCSGYSDAIAAESEAMVNYYTEAGLPRDQLVATGSLVNDVMSHIVNDREAKRTALCNEMDLSPEFPIILSALPPDSLYMTGGRPECDFSTYPEIVEFWVKSLAEMDGWNVLIAVHPSIPFEEMAYIEDWGVKIIKRPTAEVIPLCNLYVASVSSTIRWSIASGIPVINYDVYRYHYTDFMQVKGVLYTEEKDEFRGLLKKMAAIDQRFLEEITAFQSQEAAHWGCLDGRSGQRMLQLIDHLIVKYQPENTIE